MQSNESNISWRRILGVLLFSSTVLSTANAESYVHLKSVIFHHNIFSFMGPLNYSMKKMHVGEKGGAQSIITFEKTDLYRDDRDYINWWHKCDYRIFWNQQEDRFFSYGMHREKGQVYELYKNFRAPLDPDTRIRSFETKHCKRPIVHASGTEFIQAERDSLIRYDLNIKKWRSVPISPITGLQSGSLVFDYDPDERLFASLGSNLDEEATDDMWLKISRPFSGETLPPVKIPSTYAKSVKVIPPLKKIVVGTLHGSSIHLRGFDYEGKEDQTLFLEANETLSKLYWPTGHVPSGYVYSQISYIRELNRLIIMKGPHVVSIDPDSGKVLWQTLLPVNGNLGAATNPALMYDSKNKVLALQIADDWQHGEGIASYTSFFRIDP